MLGKSPSYPPTGGAASSWGRLPVGISNGVGVAAGVLLAPGATGGAGAGEFREPGLGGYGLRGGGGEDEPTWANSSLNIQTFCSLPTPVQVTPGALSSDPTPISV